MGKECSVSEAGIRGAVNRQETTAKSQLHYYILPQPIPSKLETVV
jgi:hypothetical protein